ncbi:MAG: BrnT family toxin [Syntrophobacteraceae bacterium]
MGVQFEWDSGKAELNLRKHGVGFAEAGTVFRDPLAFIFDDEPHSGEERREIIIGRSAGDHLLLVCFTERTENVVRIISARSATERERKGYEKNRGI